MGKHLQRNMPVAYCCVRPTGIGSLALGKAWIAYLDMAKTASNCKVTSYIRGGQHDELGTTEVHFTIRRVTIGAPSSVCWQQQSLRYLPWFSNQSGSTCAQGRS